MYRREGEGGISDRITWSTIIPSSTSTYRILVDIIGLIATTARSQLQLQLHKDLNNIHHLETYKEKRKTNSPPGVMPNNQPPPPSSDDYPAMDIGSDDIAQIDNANNNNVDNEHDDDDALFTIRNRNRAGGSRSRPNQQARGGSRSGVTECIDLTRGVTYQAPERSIADLSYGERARFLARRREVLPNDGRSQANNRAAGSERREVLERVRRWNRGELTASDEERDRFLNASTDDEERELDRQLNARIGSPDDSERSATPMPDPAPAAGPSRRRQALPNRAGRNRAGAPAEDDLQSLISGHNTYRQFEGRRYHKSMFKILILTSNFVSRTSHLDKIYQPGPDVRSSRTLRLEIPTETFERKQGELRGILE